MQSTTVKSKYYPVLMYCVLGSAAAAERVWSMAGKVLTNELSSLSPRVFQLIMYPTCNNRLGKINNVMEANSRRWIESPAVKKRSAIGKERLQRMMAELIGWNPDDNGETVDIK